jgi:hypothetical protein
MYLTDDTENENSFGLVEGDDFEGCPEEDEFEYEPVVVTEEEKRVYEILTIKPDKLTEEDKREFIDLFSVFLDKFGKFGD